MLWFSLQIVYKLLLKLLVLLDRLSGYFWVTIEKVAEIQQLQEEN